MPPEAGFIYTSHIMALVAGDIGDVAAVFRYGFGRSACLSPLTSHLCSSTSCPDLLDKRQPAMTGYFSSPFPRRTSVGVDVGGVMVGGGSPVVVQSMTNTDTADVDQTVAQVAALHRAGSEIVRITVDRDESAAAVPAIRERLERLGINVPLVGDFHYIGHKLLADHPACAEALAKYRINPGNVGFKDKKDRQFAAIVEMAIRYDKPVRIGVNWGSADGRQPEPGFSADRAGSDARGDRAVRHPFGRNGRGDRPWP
jgi:hypothetical protein